MYYPIIMLIYKIKKTDIHFNNFWMVKWYKNQMHSNTDHWMNENCIVNFSYIKVNKLKFYQHKLKEQWFFFQLERYQNRFI